MMKKSILVISLILLGVMGTKSIYDIIEKERYIKSINKNTETNIELIDLLKRNNKLIEGVMDNEK